MHYKIGAKEITEKFHDALVENYSYAPNIKWAMLVVGGKYESNRAIQRPKFNTKYPVMEMVVEDMEYDVNDSYGYYIPDKEIYIPGKTQNGVRGYNLLADK